MTPNTPVGGPPPAADGLNSGEATQRGSWARLSRAICRLLGHSSWPVTHPCTGMMPRCSSADGADVSSQGDGGPDPDPALTVLWDGGLCASVDPEMWFPEKGGSTREAKRVCAACPVRPECLAYAQVNDIYFGIWGGLSERERRRERRERAA